MSFDFSTKTHGKWILAGEHAVLRGHPALVFPLLSQSLQLEYKANAEPIQTTFSGTFAEDVHLLFWSVLEHGFSLIKKPITNVKGSFHVCNEIPCGAGLGVSAALCASLARWFVAQAYIDKQELFTFAQQLEDLFHSESSGVDIAGVLNSRGVCFVRGKADIEPLKMAWQPHWYLSHSEQIGITAHCVKKVKKLFEAEEQRALSLDQAMSNSVQIAKHALGIPEKNGLPLLVEAIRQANACFKEWGLTHGKVDNHINELLQAGALAAKPTGSGSGGYVLSVWATPLSESPLSSIEFIPLF